MRYNSPRKSKPVGALLPALLLGFAAGGWLPGSTLSSKVCRWPARAYIVNYADDFVICCRGRAEEALATMRAMMTKLKLTVNETKTRVSKLPEEKFDFLGYSFGRCYSPKTGRAYLGTVPAKKRVIRICQAISSETGRNRTLLDHKTVVTKLNQTEENQEDRCGGC
jgi:RNA-directed DNA polymerase